MSSTAVRTHSSRRRLALPLLLVAVAALLGTRFTGGVPAATAAAGLPADWPSTVQLGMADSPDGAAAMKQTAPFGFRYQYLAGGVNTGNGWVTWNAGGEFVTFYIQDSIKNGIIPVFTYYQLRQSNPGSSADDGPADLSNLQNSSTMRAYYNELKLFFQKAAAFRGHTVVLHVEPDLWGFLEQKAQSNDAGTVAAAVASSGMPELAGMPDTVAGFAQAIKQLRDSYAPNVLLGYHLSVWGTGDDIQYSKPANTVVQADAQQAATFYQSLGANFDLTFAEASDRDAAFKQYQYGDGGKSWWSGEDYRRNELFLATYHSSVGLPIVEWQLPLGNTKMQAENNTWEHYQDNHVETLIGDPNRAVLQTYAQAGVVAFLFGRGADGATCACDAANDGVTNPAPIDGNAGLSLSADDDGGYFRQQAAAYYQARPTPIGGSAIAAGNVAPVVTVPITASPAAAASAAAAAVPATAPQALVTGASLAANPVSAGTTARITVSVQSDTATTMLVDAEVYDPSGNKVGQQIADNQSFAAGQTHAYLFNWSVPAAAAPGTYTVKIGVFSPGWSALFNWNDSAGTFTVQ